MSTERNYWIDIWKVVFAIMIVICHSTVLPTANTSKTIAPLAYLGVEFFFIVSGFFMAKSISAKQGIKPESLGKETFSFIVHKIKIFLPYYLFAFVVSITVVSIAKHYSALEFGRNFETYVWDALFLRITGLKGYTADSAVGGTWYLSAMIAAMFIIYPFLRKHSEFFIHWIAPLIAFFGIGWICRKFGRLNVAIDWKGESFFADGLIRGLSEICLGIWCYGLSYSLSKHNFTKIGKGLLTFIELGSWIGILCWMFFGENGYQSFLFLPLYCIALVLATSGHTYCSHLFKSKFFKNFGTLSLCLYLNHFVWIKLFKALRLSISFKQELLLYLVLVFSSSLICMYFTQSIKYLWTKYRTKVKSIFVSPE